MKPTRSESCSKDPDSRRSERIGRLSWRCSTARESCDSAMMGTSSSRASNFSERELLAHRDVRRHAERQRRLPHAGPGSDDDEIARLETGGEAVEVAEPRS